MQLVHRACPSREPQTWLAGSKLGPGEQDRWYWEACAQQQKDEGWPNGGDREWSVRCPNWDALPSIHSHTRDSALLSCSPTMWFCLLNKWWFINLITTVSPQETKQNIRLVQKILLLTLEEKLPTGWYLFPWKPKINIDTALMVCVSLKLH